MVEWIGPIISAVALLLQRIDEKEKKLKERVDIKDALMDLLHLLRYWSWCAEQTNAKLQEWIDRGKPDNAKMLAEAGTHQYAAADEVLRTSGLESWSYSVKGDKYYKSRAGSTIADLFYVYAPGLEKQFQEAIDARLASLQGLREELQQGAGPSLLEKAVRSVTGAPQVSIKSDFGPQELGEFQRSADDLFALCNALARFIAQNFELKQHTAASERSAPSMTWEDSLYSEEGWELSRYS